MKYWFIITLIVGIVGCQTDPPSNEPGEVNEGAVEAPVVLKYGFDLAKFEVIRGEISQNDFLSTILNKHGLGPAGIDQLVRNTESVFDVKKIRPGHEYAVIYEPGDSAASHFVYEKNAIDYVVFSLQDSLYAWDGQRPVTTQERSSCGVIESSLYNTCRDIGIDASLAMELANIYAWTIDFYRIDKGDEFSVVFEEKLVDDTPVGTGRILAASFVHKGEDFNAFYYEQGEQGDYFDEEGNSLRKAFLQAPLKFSRMSSAYSKKRFHPVLKRYKAHLGTDYAAPHGTPIMAVGDGEVIKSGFGSGNGNYVKIRHNSTYDTQYLHMSKRAVKVGDYVRQGETIGYVGSTGLATGPHVCFRFWKNGEQVDHRREKFPPSEPIKEEYRAGFNEVLAELNNKLNIALIPEER
jgi:murein DD-endopeptidase MepM/ murein hydrolase activator NlpD